MSAEDPAGYEGKEMETGAANLEVIRCHVMRIVIVPLTFCRRLSG